jgi:DNA-binding response OmpR family regulator
VASGAVLVLADDLIWATRLTAHVRAAGAEATHLRDGGALESALAERPLDAAVIVDLTARAYNGIRAIELAKDAGLRVLAVGQHDDAALRKRALAAGAERVYAYRKLFVDGPSTLAAWLGTVAARPER